MKADESVHPVAQIETERMAGVNPADWYDTVDFCARMRITSKRRRLALQNALRRMGCSIPNGHSFIASGADQLTALAEISNVPNPFEKKDGNGS